MPYAVWRFYVCFFGITVMTHICFRLSRAFVSLKSAYCVISRFSIVSIWVITVYEIGWELPPHSILRSMRQSARRLDRKLKTQIDGLNMGDPKKGPNEPWAPWSGKGLPLHNCSWPGTRPAPVPSDLPHHSNTLNHSSPKITRRMSSSCFAQKNPNLLTLINWKFTTFTNTAYNFCSLKWWPALISIDCPSSQASIYYRETSRQNKRVNSCRAR